MSTYTDHLARASLTPTAEEMEQLATAQAHQLFAICDREQKGFITKRDMQRLQSELPLEPDQLEAVFDSLDDDKNGFLTLEEFTGGFGTYLGINAPGEQMSHTGTEVTCDTTYEEDNETAEEEKQFHNLIESMGAHMIFEDLSTLKSLWTKIRQDEPEMMSNFEDFLYKVTSDMQRSKVDLESLEAALKSKSVAHDEEVRKLYEEMEYQIKQEKEKILSEEHLKERHMRESLEKEISEKDKQFQELAQRHQELEEKLAELNMVEAETKQENDKLQREKDVLEDILMKSEENLEETKAYIGQLRSQQKDEKRERARAALKLTENIALERESLVKQLELLRDVNKRLRDDKDEAETRRLDADDTETSDDLSQILEAEARAKRGSVRKKELCKQGSILGNYFPSNRGRMDSTEESVEYLENNNSIEPNDVAEYKCNNSSVTYLNDDNIGDDFDDVECDDDLIVRDQSSVHSKRKHIINRGSPGGINGSTSFDAEDNVIGGSSTNTKSRRRESTEDVSSTDDESNEKDSKTRRNRSKQNNRERKRDGTQKKADIVDPLNSANVVPPGGGTSQFCIAPPGGQEKTKCVDYEDVTDNIDMLIASAYEDSLEGRQNSIFFETFGNVYMKSDDEIFREQDADIESFVAMGTCDLKKSLMNLYDTTQNVDYANSSSRDPKSKRFRRNYSKSTVDNSGDQTLRSTNPTPFGQSVMKVSAATAFAAPKYSSYYGSKENFSPDTPRGQPVGAVNANEEQEAGQEESMEFQRQRLFKVVFVGDSGVGKSSFIHRFCNDNFNPTFSATIGVDFQVKTLIVDGQIIVLQLWDTAGQERFRSITKQYFRKADGVVVMYDVTSEVTFTHVRNWMTSVQEGVEDGTALVIVGNKTDMCDGDEKRVVKSKDGSKLALEYDALFFESSAKAGSAVRECMEAMANLLKEKEDVELEKALHLDESMKKKGCCS